MRDAARSAANQQSKRSKAGNVGEKVADELHEICRLRHVATVTKVASNLKVIGSEGRIARAVYTQKSTVDCLGWLHEGARFVAVEVKHVTPEPSARGGYRPCSLPMVNVATHQRMVLDSVLAAGGVAVLLVIHGVVAQYAVPWVEARAVEGSLRDEPLERHRIQRGEAYLARWAKGGA